MMIGPGPLSGETGTGKELVAHAFHQIGPRRTPPVPGDGTSLAVFTGMQESYMNPERRKMPRVHVDRELRVALVAPPMELTLIELGLGGFSVRSARALPPETIQMFRFEGPDGSVEQLKVLIRRCDGAHGPGYVIGCEFANATHPAVGRAIGRLMDQITAVLSFS